MQNYVLRIYRREEINPRILVGGVEKAGVEELKAYTNLDDPWNILNPKKDVQK